MRSFIICTHPQISIGRSNKGERGGRDVWHAWERKIKCTRFWWKSQKGMRPLRRPRHRREVGIRMDLRETGWGSVEWIQLTQGRGRWLGVVNTVMNLLVLDPRI
jgi:hypothetical protein